MRIMAAKLANTPKLRMKITEIFFLLSMRKERMTKKGVMATIQSVTTCTLVPM